jgi:PIN domain nuclease of toxin-antitoxin system
LNILLDTNALVWIGDDPKRLGKSATRLYKSASKVYYSTFSLFELRIKQAKEKFTISDSLEALLENAGMAELRPNSSESKELSRFGSLLNHDPFDRMILAQASANNLTLLTSDRQLLSLGFEWIKDARL